MTDFKLGIVALLALLALVALIIFSNHQTQYEQDKFNKCFESARNAATDVEIDTATDSCRCLYHLTTTPPNTHWGQ